MVPTAGRACRKVIEAELSSVKSKIPHGLVVSLRLDVGLSFSGIQTPHAVCLQKSLALSWCLLAGLCDPNLQDTDDDGLYHVHRDDGCETPTKQRIETTVAKSPQATAAQGREAVQGVIKYYALASNIVLGGEHKSKPGGNPKNHVTVIFKKANGSHVTAKHVYTISLSGLYIGASNKINMISNSMRVGVRVGERSSLRSREISTITVSSKHLRSGKDDEK
ncbi:hypothetical protein FISHEDRAFT_55223 [Fistulina hepatica ATCC 64428]|uniref:Uncharacterized protein n=1 Tax=Fistulina hepatica ATCC 64428 TaxID=1128425 RepID=A0A0D7ANB4_9AGAR|nr:hypothetical protein FISHEDRAFT_55223 [Fistulina hepatica ATCC 64428]